MGNQNSGGRPQPTAVTKLRGNPGKKKLNEREPKPPPGQVVKPATLSPGAAAVWDELAPICLYMGTLTPADVTAFARMCELEETWNVNTALKGTEAFSHRRELDTASTLRAYSALFGLEPVSRARISVQQAQPTESKWAAVS